MYQTAVVDSQRWYSRSVSVNLKLRASSTKNSREVAEHFSSRAGSYSSSISIPLTKSTMASSPMKNGYHRYIAAFPADSLNIELAHPGNLCIRVVRSREWFSMRKPKSLALQGRPAVLSTLPHRLIPRPSVPSKFNGQCRDINYSVQQYCCFWVKHRANTLS